MSTLVDELSARAKALSAEDRARLAEELLESLQGEADADAEAAWDREIEHQVRNRVGRRPSYPRRRGPHQKLAV